MSQQQIEDGEARQDPDGSIFLVNRLTHREFNRQYFALLLGRGAYRGLSLEDIEDELRELKVRRAISEHLDTQDVS